MSWRTAQFTSLSEYLTALRTANKEKALTQNSCTIRPRPQLHGVPKCPTGHSVRPTARPSSPVERRKCSQLSSIDNARQFITLSVRTLSNSVDNTMRRSTCHGETTVECMYNTEFVFSSLINCVSPVHAARLIWVLLMRQHWAIRDTDEKTRNVFSVFGCDCMVGTISGKSLKLLPPDVIF